MNTITYNLNPDKNHLNEKVPFETFLTEFQRTYELYQVNKVQYFHLKVVLICFHTLQI